MTQDGKTDTADLIDAYATAQPENRDAAYRDLVNSVWNDGQPTDLSVGAVPVLLEQLGRVDGQRQGGLLVLLGLLVETDDPGTEGELTRAVGKGIDQFLELWTASSKDQPVFYALQYLLAHFPADRDRILAVAGGRDLEDDDFSRFDRALQELDPAHPVLGRVFPSPSVWEMDESEREFDNGWIKTLSPEQVRQSWEQDTGTVIGHLGAKAHWAVANDTAPRPWESDSIPPRRSAPEDVDPELFTSRGVVIRCPECDGPVSVDQRGAECGRCAISYPTAGGILNLSAGVRADDEDTPKDFLFKLAEMPTMGFFYEAYARPNFLRLCGSNWDTIVSPADEDAYIAEHVAPVDGPVLDLAAGAGRWTETLARAVGAERVIAVDPSVPMLTTLRGRLPEIPAVVAGGSRLPFEDASLGAALCWNALQAFPQDAPAAVKEVGRCLRPGGTFSLLTFRNSADPLYRHFVASHRFPQHAGGLHLLELDDVKSWLHAAGLTIRSESGPGTFVFITAERPR
jgi:SAM-dependent methyltransferase